MKSAEIWDQLLEFYTFVDQPDNLILAGDFNSRLDVPSKKGEQMKEFADYNNLVLANPLPLQKTFVTKKGSSVIDLVFTGKGIKVKNFKVLDIPIFETIVKSLLSSLCPTNLTRETGHS
jgi:endonuclease/exonuclease/phosphatase family metal-dependent hydrolase